MANDAPPEPFGMGVYVEDGHIVMAFTQEIAWLKMTQEQCAQAISQLSAGMAAAAKQAIEESKTRKLQS